MYSNGDMPSLRLYIGVATLESGLTIFYKTKDMFPIYPRTVTPFTQEKWKSMWCDYEMCPWDMEPLGSGGSVTRGRP